MCCGNAPRPIRVQHAKNTKQSVPTLRAAKTATIIKSSAAKKPTQIKKSSVVKAQRCIKCGYPAIILTSGKTKLQCTNAECKYIQ